MADKKRKKTYGLTTLAKKELRKQELEAKNNITKVSNNVVNDEPVLNNGDSNNFFNQQKPNRYGFETEKSDNTNVSNVPPPITEDQNEKNMNPAVKSAKIVPDKRMVGINDDGTPKTVTVETSTPQPKLTLEDYSSEFDKNGNIVIPEKRIDDSIQNRVKAATYNALKGTGIENTGMGDVITGIMTPIFTGLEQMQRGNRETKFGREIVDNVLGLANIGIGSIPSMVGVNALSPFVTALTGDVAEGMGMKREEGEKVGHLLSLAPFGSEIMLAGLFSNTAGEFISDLIKDKNIDEVDKERIVETVSQVGFFTGLGAMGMGKNIYRNVRDRLDLNSLNVDKITPKEIDNAIAQEIQLDKTRQIVSTLEKDKQTAEKQFEEAQTPEERLKAVDTIEKVTAKQEEYKQKLGNISEEPKPIETVTENKRIDDSDIYSDENIKNPGYPDRTNVEEEKPVEPIKTEEVIPEPKNESVVEPYEMADEELIKYTEDKILNDFKKSSNKDDAQDNFNRNKVKTYDDMLQYYADAEKKRGRTVPKEIMDFVPRDKEGIRQLRIQEIKQQFGKNIPEEVLRDYPELKTAKPESKLKDYKITIEKKPAGIFHYTEKAKSRKEAIEKLKNNPENINDDIVQAGKIREVEEVKTGNEVKQLVEQQIQDIKEKIRNEYSTSKLSGSRNRFLQTEASRKRIARLENQLFKLEKKQPTLTQKKEVRKKQLAEKKVGKVPKQQETKIKGENLLQQINKAIEDVKEVDINKETPTVIASRLEELGYVIDAVKSGEFDESFQAMYNKAQTEKDINFKSSRLTGKLAETGSVVKPIPNTKLNNLSKVGIGEPRIVFKDANGTYKIPIVKLGEFKIKLEKAKIYKEAKQTIKSALSKDSGISFGGLSKLGDIADPKVLKAVYDVAKYHYGNFKDFSKKVIEDLGDWIKPHLRELHDRVKGEMDLIARHNIWEHKLKFADEIGGIANPSLAITKKGQPFEKFGDITLVADKSMINPSNKDAKVFGADIYSPRYPSITASLDYSKFEQLNEKVYNSYTKYKENPEWRGKNALSSEQFTEYNKRGLADNEYFQIYYLDEIAKEKNVDYSSYGSIRDAIKRHEADYGNFVDKTFAEVTKDKKIFKGYTYNGNRSYSALTLENLSKILKKDLRGGENFNYGSGNLRASVTPEFKKINDIVKAKDKLVSEKDFDKIKEEIDSELFDLANSYGGRNASANNFIEIVSDAIKRRKNIISELKEYGFDFIDDYNKNRLFDFLAKLKTLPTEYFESVITRPVKLSEFKTAIVPENVSPNVLEILDRNGISDVRKYKDATERQSIVDNLDYGFGKQIEYKQYQNALNKLREKINRPNMTFGLDTLPEVYTIAKYHTGKFVEWSKKVIADVGNWVRPHLRNLWNEINKDRTGLDNVVTQGLSFKKKSEIIKNNIEKPQTEVRDISEIIPTTKNKRIITASDIFTKGDKEAGKDVFNYDNFTESSQINELIKETSTDNKKAIDEQKRDVRTWAKTQEGADLLRGMGFTEESFLKQVKGDSLLAERIMAGKDIVNVAGKQLLERIKTLPKGNDPKIALADDYIKYVALVKNLKGLISESGRALNIARKKSSDDVKVKIDLADELIKAGFDTSTLPDFSRKALEIIEPTYKDKFYYWWYNSMLSNPLTDVANITGNLSHFGFELMRNAITQNPKDSMQMLRDMRQAHTEGMKQVKDIIKNGETADSKFDINERRYGEAFQPTSKAGKMLKGILPTTRLAFEDAYFRNMFGAIRKNATLKEISKETGDPVGIVENLIKAVAHNPDLISLDKKFEIYQKHLNALERYIDYGVFQTPLGKGGSLLQRGINHIPPLKLIFPFIKIATNIAKTGIRTTPYGFKDLLNKDLTRLERKDVISRAVTGSALLAGLGYLISQGAIEITGHGVNDKDKRELWHKQGYKENHFYMNINGEKYGFSYQNINPINIPFSIIGNWQDDIKYNTTKKDINLSSSERIAKSLIGMAETLSDQSFMQGISNLMRYIQDKDIEGLKKNAQSLFTPNILSFPRDVKNMLGDGKKQYETSDFESRLKDKIGMTEGLKPKLNQFGEQTKSTYERFPFIVSKAKSDDKLTDFLAKNDIEISFPSKQSKIGDQIINESPETYYQYTKLSGERFKEELLKQLPELEKLKTKEEKDDAVHKIVNDVRKQVREEMAGKPPKEKKGKLIIPGQPNPERNSNTKKTFKNHLIIPK